MERTEEHLEGLLFSELVIDLVLTNSLTLGSGLVLGLGLGLGKLLNHKYDEN